MDRIVLMVMVVGIFTASVAEPLILAFSDEGLPSPLRCLALGRLLEYFYVVLA